MIGKGEHISNLYILDVDDIAANSPHQQYRLNTNVVVDSALWQNRLGHTSISKTDSLIDVVDFKKKNKSPFHCAICPLAKEKHLPFASQNNVCDNTFELLHIDIWGPFSVSIAEGYKYFLTIVDDHTRVTWIYLLRTKAEVLTVFPYFLQMIETHYKAVVKAVRSDNAPELKFKDLFKKGIVPFHSCSETPEQNSVVERKHQHILNVARSLMFQSKTPLEFWGDCVLTAVFLVNRLPTPLLNDKSPYEVLTSKRVNYSGLHVFGCLAYCSTSSKNRHKFQPRSRSCVFLGSPAGYKGYKLLDLETNKIHISRNVLFHEDLFPFTEGQSDFISDFFSPTVDSSFSNRPDVENVETGSPRSIHDDSVADAGSERVKRSSKTPAYLQDYFCNITETEIPYPLSAYMSYEKLCDEYKAYICVVPLHPEPTSFTQAKKFDEWLKAMNEELFALESTGTWMICSLPPDKHAIGCKWVYKIKVHADGSLEHYKARLVAKGYTQQEGVDFVDTFSPVPKMTTVKTLLAVAAAKKWSLTQLDISNAFLNGDLDEEI
uniref:Retrovirus-related Pol polyprotein from transposon TNT 1-94 n=1 Tax=Noccaea caerulescens TaxID=107243 RepID=A0A1J3JNZ9_NOCCA